uniref:Uncharacterized protein n=1 Tax=Rhizophora mucronata TaxID=61149 RepID=A0A2P2NDQ1_RHIMU
MHRWLLDWVVFHFILSCFDFWAQYDFSLIAFSKIVGWL